MRKPPYGKVWGLETNTGAQRIKGVLRSYYDTKRQKWVVRSWPKGNGGDTPLRRAAREQFAVVQQMIKNVTTDEYVAARDLTAGTPLLIRDVLMKAAYGTLVEAVLKDGSQWMGIRTVYPTAQQMLDSISGIQGTVLYRDVDAWKALAPGTPGQVLSTAGPGANPSWVDQSGGGGGGYDKGNPPAIVQIAHSGSAVNGIVMGAAPTAGNLLVAICFNSASATGGSGWTKSLENASGTDWCDVMTKIAGASESATQSPMASTTTAGGCVIYELSATGTTPIFVTGTSQAEQTGTGNTPLLLPCAKDCLAISATAVITQTITNTFNAPALDVLDNTGNRKLAAAHYDLSLAPGAGLIATLSASGSNKSASVIIANPSP